MKVSLCQTYDGIEAYLKANATDKAKGYPAWQISFRAYSDNPDEWMDEYHIRSMVEAVFSSLKRCFGPDIKTIKGWLKRRELAIKVLACNIKRVQPFHDSWSVQHME